VEPGQEPDHALDQDPDKISGQEPDQEPNINDQETNSVEFENIETEIFDEMFEEACFIDNLQINEHSEIQSKELTYGPPTYLMIAKWF